jgi:NitT/TauT family transport system substrate-binding protein
MYRRELLRLTGGGVVAALTGCSRNDSGGEGTLVRVIVQPRLSMGGFYVAYEDGYFAEAGLRIETHTMTHSLQMVPLLASGQFGVAMVGLSPALINAVDRGANLRIVAGREFASRTCGSADTLYGSQSSFPNGLDDLSALRGKRIALTGRQTKNEYVLDQMLERGGLTQDDIEIVTLEQAQAVAALFSGRIDAMISSQFEKDPIAASSEYVKGPGLIDFLPNHQRGYVGFGPPILEADHDIGVRFLTAYLRGVNAYLDGRTPAFLDDLARADGLDVQESLTACRDTMVRDGHVDIPSVQGFIDWTVAKGYCPDTVGVEQLVDTSYIEEVDRRLPQYLSRDDQATEGDK